MTYFVSKDSIVRRIWGKADTILFIFAGASAEFALNKAVDWLYFTGKLPADPIGRLFSTVSYARKIVFASSTDALKAIDTITAIHSAVEKNRGSQIPAWAYRDVLFMLIHYSIAAFELLERKLTPEEKEDVFDVFLRVGEGMHLVDLPANYNAWTVARQYHMENDLAHSHFTDDLFLQYKKHLGRYRYGILLESQKLVVPAQVARLLKFDNVSWLKPSVPLYKLARWLSLDGLVKRILLPAEYRSQILALEQPGV
jgi:ER-bound oxygenase mpaB/B'/Rubber oxygenase, catalytic domain